MSIIRIKWDSRCTIFSALSGMLKVTDKYFDNNDAEDGTKYEKWSKMLYKLEWIETYESLSSALEGFTGHTVSGKDSPVRQAPVGLALASLGLTRQPRPVTSSLLRTFPVVSQEEVVWPSAPVFHFLFVCKAGFHSGRLLMEHSVLTENRVAIFRLFFVLFYSKKDLTYIQFSMREMNITMPAYLREIPQGSGHSPFPWKTFLGS